MNITINQINQANNNQSVSQALQSSLEYTLENYFAVLTSWFVNNLDVKSLSQETLDQLDTMLVSSIIQLSDERDANSTSFSKSKLEMFNEQISLRFTLSEKIADLYSDVPKFEKKIINNRVSYNNNIVGFVN